MPVDCAVALACDLGECPRWHVASQTLYWVDILGHTLHWWSSTMGIHAQHTFAELILPVQRPTSVAFGGADLQTLFITAARVGLTNEQLAAQALAGSVLQIETDSAGLAAYDFAT